VWTERERERERGREGEGNCIDVLSVVFFSCSLLVQVWQGRKRKACLLKVKTGDERGRRQKER
jgi:hypothetical protein